MQRALCQAHPLPSPAKGPVPATLEAGPPAPLALTGAAGGDARLPFSLQLKHCQTECVTDTQICGARFCDPEGRTFALTGYDLSEIIRYAQL